jgi:hypothetical protein
MGVSFLLAPVPAWLVPLGWYLGYALHPLAMRLAGWILERLTSAPRQAR